MGKKVILLIMIPLCLLNWHWFQPAPRKNLKGIEAYRNKKYQEALNQFLSAKGIDPTSQKLKNNTASALYQLKKYEEALREFSTITPRKMAIPQSSFSYNLGNTYYRMGKYQEALDQYKKSIIHAPNDLDAKKNYELTLKKLNEQQNSNRQQPDQQQQTQPPPQNDQIMQFLNQNEKEQMEKKKRQAQPVQRIKDW